MIPLSAQVSKHMSQLAFATMDAPASLHSVAISIAQHMRRGAQITRQALKRFMLEAFGANDAHGAWAMRDAYDALEAAQVMLLQDADCPLLQGAPWQIFAALRAFEHALPTQTYRSERQIEFQQFSTPLSLAWLAGLAGQIRQDDLVLEPSAGTGMLAVHAWRARAGLQLNELDPKRADLLGRIFDRTVTRHDGEHIDDLLAGAPSPTLVLINPPFSRSAGRGVDRHAGARHLRAALARLAPGGRCVAIMPPNFAADGTASLGYTAVAEMAPPRAEITIRGNPYAKHGTGIDVRLLITTRDGRENPSAMSRTRLRLLSISCWLFPPGLILSIHPRRPHHWPGPVPHPNPSHRRLLP